MFALPGWCFDSKLQSLKKPVHI